MKLKTCFKNGSIQFQQSNLLETAICKKEYGIFLVYVFAAATQKGKPQKRLCPSFTKLPLASRNITCIFVSLLSICWSNPVWILLCFFCMT